MLTHHRRIRILAVKGIRTFITDFTSKWKWRFDSKLGCFVTQFGSFEQFRHRLVLVPFTASPGEPQGSNGGRCGAEDLAQTGSGERALMDQEGEEAIRRR